MIISVFISNIKILIMSFITERNIMPTLKAIYINPKVLKWARRNMGMSEEEADKAFKSKGKIKLWESGRDYPTISQLDKLANLYKRPSAVFYLKTVPNDDVLPNDFRSLKNKDYFTPNTLLLIRRSKRIQSKYIELLELLKKNKYSSLYNLNIRSNIENATQEIRKILNAPIEKQLKWKKNQTLNNWIEILNALGILVLRMKVDYNQFRGFSIYNEDAPLIVINKKDANPGQTFTLFHEFCHILLKQDGLCDIEGTEKIEIFCNHFSGAFLVPKDDLLNNLIVKDKNIDDFSDNEIQKLSNIFKVSRETILRRLLTFKRISNEFYNEKRIILNIQWEEKLKERLEKNKNKDIIRNIPAECISEKGKVYISNVLEAFSRDLINYSDLSDLLGVKLKHIPKIENKL